MVGKKDVVVKAAKWLGPLAVDAVARVHANPAAWKTVKEQSARLVARNGDSPDDVLATIEKLRDMVDYLDESADDAAETERARTWAKQLERYEQAAHLLKAPGSAKDERVALKKKVDALRSVIFSAFIIEKDEDDQAAGSLEQ